MIRSTLLAIVLAFAPVPALAHKVILGVFPSGAEIEGELGFSNGTMAEKGQLVEVFDTDGNKLGETSTDEDGFFTYRPVSPVAHVFRANLGAGHVAEASMSVDEVGKILARGEAPGAGATLAWSGETETAAPLVPLPAAAPSGKSAATMPTTGECLVPAAAPAALTAAELDAIARIVRDETRPLRQEISAYKEKNDLQSVLGGFGYIAGLFGLGFYVAARRKLKEAA